MLISLRSLCSALSTQRLSGYSTEDDWDSSDAVARYLWNGALCAALHPALHSLEVSLRNSLFRASEEAVNVAGRRYGSIRCWLDVAPTFLLSREQGVVEKAKARLGRNRKYHRPGYLVAKLGFGFWTSLCQRPYEQGRSEGPELWPRLIPRVFPHVPKPQRSRALIASRLDSVRDFRNRVAHHEPIWDRELLVRYDEALECLGWIDPAMRLAARACSNLELTFHGGPEAFRPLAVRLLGATL